MSSKAAQQVQEAMGQIASTAVEMLDHWELFAVGAMALWAIGAFCRAKAGDCLPGKPLYQMASAMRIQAIAGWDGLRKLNVLLRKSESAYATAVSRAARELSGTNHLKPLRVAFEDATEASIKRGSGLLKADAIDDLVNARNFEGPNAGKQKQAVANMLEAMNTMHIDAQTFKATDAIADLMQNKKALKKSTVVLQGGLTVFDGALKQMRNTAALNRLIHAQSVLPTEKFDDVLKKAFKNVDEKSLARAQTLFNEIGRKNPKITTVGGLFDLLSTSPNKWIGGIGDTIDPLTGIKATKADALFDVLKARKTAEAAESLTQDVDGFGKYFSKMDPGILAPTLRKIVRTVR